jgi:hypothetical protein
MWPIAAGVVLGLTFLSHSAPALLLALTTVMLALWHGWERAEERLPALRVLLVIGVVSFLISLVFLYPIFAHYKFEMLNTAPVKFVGLDRGELIKETLSLKVLVAGPTFFVLIWRADWLGIVPDQRKLILSLILSTGALFVYGVGADLLRFHGVVDLPRPIASFHFHLYLTAWFSLLFGIGLFALARYFAGARLIRPEVIFLAVVVVLTLFSLPGYAQRYDIKHYKEKAELFASDHSSVSLYRWLLLNTDSDAVVLTDDRLGLYAVAAAGRKVVSMEALFTSPYIDHARRDEDRDVLMYSLANGDVDRFRQLADRYGVSHLVLRERLLFGRENRQVSIAKGFDDVLESSYRVEDMQVYRVNK